MYLRLPGALGTRLRGAGRGEVGSTMDCVMGSSSRPNTPRSRSRTEPRRGLHITRGAIKRSDNCYYYLSGSYVTAFVDCAFGWLVLVAKQSNSYRATLWRSHNRDKYVGFSHILLE